MPSGRSLPPGIWFVFRPGYGRYRGSYPVTWHGWCLGLGVPCVYMLLAAGCAWYLVTTPTANAALWIGTICAGVIVSGLCLAPVVRRHTDFTVTLGEWRDRR